LEAGGEAAGKKLDDAGKTSGDKLISGAEQAAKKLAEAVKGDKGNGDAMNNTDKFTEMIHTFITKTFDDFKQRVPQHALI
jgi:hypothetical protein